MNCINTSCNIYNACNIKEVAQHCIIHKKLKLILSNKKDSLVKQAQINPYPASVNMDEMIESYDEKQKD